MSDIKDIRLLWLKGGLFLFLGCFAALLIVIRMDSIAEVILLGICIWGFCRCYYFAFYVIEKYVDPSFRFSGLFAFAKYSIFSAAPSPLDPTPIPETAKLAGNAKHICVHWLVGTAISNVAIPLAYPRVEEFLSAGPSEFFAESIWIAWLVAQLAFVAALGALSKARLARRWPVSLVAFLALLTSLEVGLFSIERVFPSDDAVVLFIFATASFIIGMAGLSSLRWLGKVHLTNSISIRDPMINDSGEIKNHEQLSIRFLLATTAAVAITASILVRVKIPLDKERIAMMVGAGGIYAFLLLLITISLIYLSLSRNSRSRKWSAITTFALLVVEPYLALRLIENFNSYGPFNAIDYANGYVFFASYLLFLSLLFLQLRMLGYQLSSDRRRRSPSGLRRNEQVC